MLNYRTGVGASAAAGRAMALYLGSESLTPEAGQTLAKYYIAGSEVDLVAPPRTHAEALGRLVHDGLIGFSEAVDELAHAAAIERRGTAEETSSDVIDRVRTELREGVDRAARGRAEASPGRFRSDMDQRLANSLGIDLTRAPTKDEVANLLTGRRADGQEIQGRQLQAPTRSIADVFGLDGRGRIPTGAEVDHVLAGKRADGAMPVDGAGQPLAAATVAGALKRLTNIYAVPAHRAGAPLPNEIEHLRAGRLASGMEMNRADYRRLINATKLPVAYVDFVLSPHKSVSTAFALAPTDAERALIVQIHRDALAGAMAHTEALLGHTRKGGQGRGGLEPGSLGWISFAHYSARPTEQTVQTDEQGREYTAFHPVPGVQAPDPQLHDHTILFNAVQTAGRVGAMDLDRLDGYVHEIGAVYQALVSAGAQKHGIEVARDDTAARFVAVPAFASDHFSKRRNEGRAAAQEYAAARGIDWNALSEKERAALLDAGSRATKLGKDEGVLASFEEWKRQARDDLRYEHRSVLRPDAIKPELSAEQRLERGYIELQRLLADEFKRNAKLGGDRMRALAAQAMIEPGLGDNPKAEISALTRLIRERGVHLHGPREPATALLWGEDVAIRGKQRISVTTTQHVDQEDALVRLARDAHAEKAPAIGKPDLERAIASRGLTLNPEQRKAVEQIAAGSRLEVVIASAGTGKTKGILPPLVDGWSAQGREVYGVAQAWKHSSSGMDGSGIEQDRLLSIASLTKREREGRITLTPNSVVVVDEVGRLGVRETLELLELRAHTGAQLVMLGDPKQCAGVEAGSPVDLLGKVVAMPEVLTSMRQRTERERQIAALFREGRAGEAIELKRADKTVELVAGGTARTVQRVAALWHERMEANRDKSDFTLSVSAPSNADARAISLAIRRGRQERGEIGPDQIVIPARDKNSGATYDLTLSVGDQVRLFDRVHDSDRPKDSPRQVLGSNGDVVEVLALSKRGMVVRGEKGQEGLVEWARLRPLGEEKTGRVQLALGYAMTIDTVQGMTTTEHIAALPNGTAAAAKGKHYVAESRHRETTWLVIDEAAERRQIHKGIPLGASPVIREEDVWRQVATNMARRSDKANATDFVKQAADLQRGSTLGLQAAMERRERREGQGRESTTARLRKSRVRHRAAVARVMERGLAQNVVEMTASLRASVARAIEAIRPVLRRSLGEEALQEAVTQPVEAHPEATRGQTEQERSREHGRRVYLAVPFDERQEAAKLGARWDRDKKAWWVNETDARKTTMLRWLVGSQPRDGVAGDAVAEFAEAARGLGLRIDGDPVMDGKRRRVRIDGDRGRQLNGSYIGHLDALPAGHIRNYKTGQELKWAMKAGAQVDPAELARLQAERAARAAQSDHDRRETEARVSRMASVVWNEAVPVGYHPYLAGKQVEGYGLRQASKDVPELHIKTGDLLVPSQDSTGQIWSLQKISRGGSKIFLPGGRMDGGHHVIGDLVRSGPLAIAEGFATGATFHQITDIPVVVAFNSGNLKAVAEQFRDLYPDRVIVFAADNDHHLPRREPNPLPNVGLEKAQEAAAAVRGVVVAPAFKPDDKGTDWNDAVAQHGLDATRDALRKAYAAAMKEAAVETPTRAATQSSGPRVRM